MMGDEILNFDQYNVFSEIRYYKNNAYDNTFHNFSIKNSFNATKPNGIDDLTFKVFQIANKQLGENLSFHKEIMVKNNEPIPSDKLSELINEMNGCLFNIEEYTNKHAIDLF